MNSYVLVFKKNNEKFELRLNFSTQEKLTRALGIYKILYYNYQYYIRSSFLFIDTHTRVQELDVRGNIFRVEEVIEDRFDSDLISMEEFYALVKSDKEVVYSKKRRRRE